MKIDIDSASMAKIKAVLSSSNDNIVDMAIEIGEDLRIFFEGGDWSELDLRECHLEGVSFYDAVLDGVVVYEDQLAILQKTKPRSIDRVVVHKRQQPKSNPSKSATINVVGETPASEASLNDFRPKINEAKNLSEAMALLRTLADHRVIPDDDILNAIVALAKTYLDVVDLMDFCRTQGYPISYQIFSRALSLSRDLDEAAALFSEMGERGFRPTTDYLLHFITDAGNIAAGEECLDTFQASGVVLTYPALLSIVQLPGVSQRWPDVLRRFDKQGVRPKIDVFHKLLAQVERVSIANEMLLAMWRGGVPAKNDTYVFVLKIATSYSEAKHVFDEMLQKGIRPNISAVHNLLRAASSSDEARDVARKAKTLDFVWSEKDLNTIAEGLSDYKTIPFLSEMKIDDRIFPYTKL
ncbi:MAG: hypothetical protein K0M60_10745 [Hydrogenophaga sp.]|nr:hypothetical protein [Hydrogenophaga sp.]